MLNLLFVFLGGAIGSVLRYGISTWFHNISATFLANVLGCFLFGILTIIILKKKKYLPKSLASMVTTGFCGGLTTFSTFSYEVSRYILNAQYIIASYYIFLSLIVGILSVYAGIEFGRILLKLHLENKRAILHREFLEGK